MGCFHDQWFVIMIDALILMINGLILMIDEFVQYEKNGTLSWTGTVEVGSLKGDASYEYYTTVPLSLNDGKGLGAFVYAATEVERAGL